MFCLVHHPFSLISGSTVGSYGPLIFSGELFSDLPASDFLPDLFDLASSSGFDCAFEVPLLLDPFDFYEVEVSFLFQFLSMILSTSIICPSIPPTAPTIGLVSS
jgi:hypothetical protein|tara:strand:- start:1370 stop:1681 length:312 start_codon:yes stop_codon:yes gene_type:complete